MTDAVRLVFGAVGIDAKSLEVRNALAAWMEKHAGLALELKAQGKYEDLVVGVRAGTIDVAWLPPVVYARLAEGVMPIGSISRDGKTSYTAALVVQKDAKYKSLADLKGARAGWVDPWSAAGFVVPRLELAKEKRDPRRMFASERFFGQHKDAMKALADGACDVAATFEGGWSEIEGLEVRVLATYGPIPGDVIAVRRNLDPARYEVAKKAFEDASKSKEARPLLRAVFGGEDLHDGIEPGHETLRLAYERGVASGLFD